ncbi:MAG: hypothetical protein MJ192_07825 [Clostridia bacterium]|nr:hypothetical protein [Clostridia bacterium]
MKTSKRSGAGAHSLVWLLRRYFWLPFGTFLLFSAISWIPRISEIRDAGNELTPDALHARQFFLLPRNTGTDSRTVPWIAVLGGIICAFILFRFLWSKRESMIYALLGVSRTTLFIQRFFFGLVSLIVPAVLSFCISCRYQITHFGVDWNGYAWKQTILFTVCFCVVALLAYAVTVLVISLTGSPLPGGLALIGLLTWPSFLLMDAKILLKRFLFGSPLGQWRESYGLWYDTYKPIPGRYLGAEQRFGFLFLPDLFEEEMHNRSFVYLAEDGRLFGEPCAWPTARLIYAAVVLLLVAAGAYLAFRMRRAEDSGKAHAPLPLLIAAFLPAAVLPAAYLSTLISSDVLTVILLLVLTPVVLTLLCMLARLSFPTPTRPEGRRTLIAAGASAAAVVLVVLFCAGGLFGYSSRVPDADNVASVRMTYVGFWQNWPNTAVGATNQPHGWTETVGYDGAGYDPNQVLFGGQPPLTSPGDIAAALDIHRAILADGHVKVGSLHRDDYGQNVLPADFMIIYTLKNGREVVRWYNALTCDTMEKALAIEETDAFRSHFAERRQGWVTDDMTCFVLSDILYAGAVAPELTAEEKRSLLDALTADMNSLTVAGRYCMDGNPDALGIIRLCDTAGEGIAVPVGEGIAVYTGGTASYPVETFYVTEAYTRTLAFMEAHGLMSAFEPSYRISAMWVNPISCLTDEELRSEADGEKQVNLTAGSVPNFIQGIRDDFIFDWFNADGLDRVDPADYETMMSHSRTTAFLTQPRRMLYVVCTGDDGSPMVTTRFLPD